MLALIFMPTPSFSLALHSYTRLTQTFNSRIDKFFLKVFPTLFIIFNIIYWLAFLL